MLPANWGEPITNGITRHGQKKLANASKVQRSSRWFIAFFSFFFRLFVTLFDHWKSDYSESPVNSPTPGRRNHPLIKTVNPDPSKPVFVQSPQSVRRELKIGEPIKITIPSTESTTKNGHPTLQRASTNQASPLRLGFYSNLKLRFCLKVLS